MVWFSCEDCGDTIKKPKLVNHYRNCSASRFSCVDCLQTFTKATVNGHTTCVTEHEKYALAATKPGGFAASGLPGKREGGPAGAPAEPTGLEFLSSRPPWKCSVCNVNCTSRETLVNHAAGAKHKRRARAALAAANGGSSGPGANVNNGNAANGGGVAKTAAEVGAPAADGVPTGKRRMEPSSSSSSSSDDSSSSDSDDDVGKHQPHAKRQAIGAGAKVSVPAPAAKVKSKPAARTSSSSSSSSDDTTSSGSSSSDSDLDAPAANKAQPKPAAHGSAQPPALGASRPTSSSSSDESCSDSDSDTVGATKRVPSAKTRTAAAPPPGQVNGKKSLDKVAQVCGTAIAHKKVAKPADSSSTSSSSSSHERSTSCSDSDETDPGKAPCSEPLKTPVSQGLSGAAAAEVRGVSNGGGAGKPVHGLFGGEEETGSSKKNKPQSSSSSESDSESDSKVKQRVQGTRAALAAQAIPSSHKTMGSAKSAATSSASNGRSSSVDSDDASDSSSDSDHSNGAHAAAAKGKALHQTKGTKAKAKTPVVESVPNGTKGTKRAAPEHSLSSESESESVSDDSSSSSSDDSDDDEGDANVEAKTKKTKRSGVDVALQDVGKFGNLVTAVKEAIEKKAEVGRAVLLRLVRSHLLEGRGEAEIPIMDADLERVRQQLVAKRICDLVNETRLTKPKEVAVRKPNTDDEDGKYGKAKLGKKVKLGK